MTKPIILVKMCVIQQIVDKVTSWPQLISNFWSHLPVCNVASDWPLHPRCFCLYITTFCEQISLLYRSIYTAATLKLNFEKLNPAIF